VTTRVIIPDLRYHKPNRKAQKQLRASLKYLTYRDNREDADHPEYADLSDRWHDRGLGDRWQDIEQACGQLKSRHVLAWSLVIGPDPQTFNQLPANEHENLLTSLTDQIVGEYYESRGLNIPEYSFVIHHAATKETHIPYPHAHIILPGSTPSGDESRRRPFYNNRDKGDLKRLHSISERAMTQLMEHELGHDWQTTRRLEIPVVADTELDLSDEAIENSADEPTNTNRQR